MTDKRPGFDIGEAHRFFSADCFNRAWELIDKPDRTSDEDERMVQLGHASLWHWAGRPDCTNKNLSIGYWQLSRIYALLGEADNARKYARICLENTPADEHFCLGYAHEALARAESIAGNDKKAQEHLAEARQHAERVDDADDKQLLVNDLKTLE